MQQYLSSLQRRQCPNAKHKETYFLDRGEITCPDLLIYLLDNDNLSLAPILIPLDLLSRSWLFQLYGYDTLPAVEQFSSCTIICRSRTTTIHHNSYTNFAALVLLKPKFLMLITILSFHLLFYDHYVYFSSLVNFCTSLFGGVGSNPTAATI